VRAGALPADRVTAATSRTFLHHPDPAHSQCWQPLSAEDNITEARSSAMRRRMPPVTMCSSDSIHRTEPALNSERWPNGVVEGPAELCYNVQKLRHWIRKGDSCASSSPAGHPTSRTIKVVSIEAGGALNGYPREMPAGELLTLRVYDDTGVLTKRPQALRYSTCEFLVGMLLCQPRESSLAMGQNRSGSATSRYRRYRHGQGRETCPKMRQVTVFGTAGLLTRTAASHGAVLPAGTHTSKLETRCRTARRKRSTRGFGIGISETVFLRSPRELTSPPTTTTVPRFARDPDRNCGKSTEVSGRGSFYLEDKDRQRHLVTMRADTRARATRNLFS